MNINEIDVSDEIWAAVQALARAEQKLDWILPDGEENDTKAYTTRELLRAQLQLLQEELRHAKADALMLETWGAPD